MNFDMVGRPKYQSQVLTTVFKQVKSKGENNIYLNLKCQPQKQAVSRLHWMCLGRTKKAVSDKNAHTFARHVLLRIGMSTVGLCETSKHWLKLHAVNP
jgi:hypothetical protein